MIPIPPNVAAAGLKSIGSITSAAIGRYRPAGVPRTGSTEDRATSYQRLLDAVLRAHSAIYNFRHVRNALGERQADEVLVPHLPRVWDSGEELLCALNGVKLRGTLSVITAAETVCAAVADLRLTEKDDAVFDEAYAVVVNAQNAFLDAARTDLGYDTRPWQLLRRRREKEFLRAQQQEAPPAIEA